MTIRFSIQTEKKVKTKAYTVQPLTEAQKALNREHYGLVMLPDDDERKIDVLGHLDVVPASPESWTKTAPFEMKVIDGIAYGRGVADDKGPTLAAIYALRAVKDLGLNAKGVRIFMGCCEETGAADTEDVDTEVASEARGHAGCQLAGSQPGKKRDGWFYYR